MATNYLAGPTLRTSWLCDGSYVDKDCVITLPEIAMQTAEFKAMGTIEIPVPLTDAIETTVAQNGLKKEYFKAFGLESKTHEFRASQQVTVDGKVKTVGIKAFIKGIVKSIPGATLEQGETVDGDISIATLRYQLFVDGEEVILIDKLNNIFKIYGKDYAESMNSYI